MFPVMSETLTLSAAEAPPVPAIAPAAMPAAPPATVRLLVPRDEAARHLAGRITRGMHLRRQRLYDLRDLEEARAAKQAWVRSCVELVPQLFDPADAVVAACCNDWVGRIFPEYAPVELFVEHYHEELDHRLRRLEDLIERLDQMPEPSPAAASATRVTARAPDGAPAHPVKPDARPAAPAPRAAVGILDLGARAGEPEHGDVARVRTFVAGLDVEMTPAPPGGGPVAVDTLREHHETAFAVVHLRPGDAEASPRRVAFALGYLAGRLGADGVCVVGPPGAHESLADELGIAHVPLDAPGGWQLQLARRLKKAGLPVDLNRLC